MNLYAPAGAQNDVGVVMNPGDTAATLSYFAQYYATDLATPGTVISQASYSVVYD